MSPSPGPIFAIADAEAEIHVIKSKPLKESRSAVTTKVIMKTKKKLITDSKVLSGMVLPLNLYVKIPCGLKSLFKWFNKDKNKILNLNIFNPLVVEPAQPPINIKNKNNIEA